MRGRVGLVLVALGAALLVTSTVGVSSVALERPITIEVSDSAAVEFDVHEPTVTEETESDVELVTLTNQVDTSLHVTAEPDDNTSIVDDVSVNDPNPIDAGEQTTITAAPRCDEDEADGPNETDVPIDVEVSGDGLTIERTIDGTVTCSSS